MKIWYGYGSEHSMNLVMIGHFKDAGDAASAKEVIDRLIEQVSADVDNGQMVIGDFSDSFTPGILDLLQKVKVHILAPDELQQLGYDAYVKLDGDKVVVTTDEADVSAFLKVLLEKGARVEVFSAHVYPNEEYGRGK
jgi:hypothetical protein